MKLSDRTGGTTGRLRVLVATLAIGVSGCRASDPLLSFLDGGSSVSFTHPPGWSVGFAEHGGVRYRYLTAPKVEEDAEALSITIIPPTLAATADAVAHAYLSGASSIIPPNSSSGPSEWTFKDSSGIPSRLHLSSAGMGRFFGAWARGSDGAMKRYEAPLDTLLASLRVEDASRWPEERFAGMSARAPSTWARGSRLSSATHATMQFKSLPLSVEKGNATIHGFITLSKGPVPAPGDLEAYNKMLKDRASDTVVLLQHRAWPWVAGVDRPAGYADYLRSGTTLTSTRIRRWITVRNRIGLMFSCEARADAFDRLDPWCQRMADTVRLE